MICQRLANILRWAVKYPGSTCHLWGPGSPDACIQQAISFTVLITLSHACQITWQFLKANNTFIVSYWKSNVLTWAHEYKKCTQLLVENKAPKKNTSTQYNYHQTTTPLYVPLHSTTTTKLLHPSMYLYTVQLPPNYYMGQLIENKFWLE